MVALELLLHGTKLPLRIRAKWALGLHLQLAFLFLIVPCLLHDSLLDAGQAHTTSSNTGAFETDFAAGQALVATGRYSEALRTFERVRAKARKSGDIVNGARAGVLVGGCQIRLFQYRTALTSLEAATKLATRAKNMELAGAAAVNTSTIYSQVGDSPSAVRVAKDSVSILERARNKTYLTKAIMNLAMLQASDRQLEVAGDFFNRAIAIAHAANLPRIESLAWDQLGVSLIFAGRLTEAETALNKALNLQNADHDINNLAFTKEHLAELELKKGKPDLKRALRWVDEAFSLASLDFRTSPQYYPIHIRGQILLGLGRRSEALAEFRRAADSATQWRQGALPGDITSTRTVANLSSVYQDYIELAADTAFKNHDEALSRQAFEVLTRSRAASLREQMTAALGRNLQLPSEYFSLLSQLQAVQAEVTLGQNATQNKAKLDEIRLQLTDLENKIGLQNQISPSTPEKIRHQNSLSDIQARLSSSEALLSFGLGKDKSFLWAVSENQIKLYELPGDNEIRMKAQEFSGAIRDQRDPSTAGRSLTQALFGQLGTSFYQKPEWLISGEGVLLNGVPFAALPNASPDNGWLIAKHSLRFVPSATLLLAPKVLPVDGRFLGIADPIYNLADSRLAHNATLVKAKSISSSISLARLVGSEREVHAAAKSSATSDLMLLTGAQASGDGFKGALAKEPELVHFAVHVVSPPDRPQEAALVLSLTKDGMPELLTSEVIATYRVPGSVVVLSGCASQQGKALPSAGLVGLSRAWLLAGASTVVVSAWPTPDDSGQFFSAFYSHFQVLKSGSLAERAARALQQAQLDMQRESGYRKSPSFWAAYSIVSKE